MKSELINKKNIILSLFVLFVIGFIIVYSLGINFGLGQTKLPEKYISEQETEKGKIITVSAPDELNYENVLSYTELSKEAPAEKIRLYHLVDGGKQEIEIKTYDKNNNGLIDYIEWTVPHLSNQTYELIIEISAAEYLDENYNFISDIYNETHELDDVWSEEILDSHYVRITFETNLSSNNDITIYPRVISGNPRIEVYEVGGDDLIAEFVNLVDNEYNKIFLTNLISESQDTFDLKIIGGTLEFDHIIDPITRYYLRGTGGSGDSFNDSLGTTMGSTAASWSPTADLQTARFTSSSAYSEETIISNESGVYLSVWCNKTAAASGDAPVIDGYTLYDCGASSTCGAPTQICTATGLSLLCDDGASPAGIIEVTSSACVKASGNHTMHTGDYLAVELSVDSNKASWPRVWYNSSSYNSYINVTEYEAAASTCSAPSSGDWAITCSHACNWSTDFNVPGNITMTGSGKLTWNANMTMNSSINWQIYKADGCEMVINPGGSIGV